jgi:hypothetical protein
MVKLLVARRGINFFVLRSSSLVAEAYAVEGFARMNEENLRRRGKGPWFDDAMLKFLEDNGSITHCVVRNIRVVFVAEELPRTFGPTSWALYLGRYSLIHASKADAKNSEVIEAYLNFLRMSPNRLPSIKMLKADLYIHKPVHTQEAPSFNVFRRYLDMNCSPIQETPL